jgi:hypothetical protein
MIIQIRRVFLSPVRLAAMQWRFVPQYQLVIYTILNRVIVLLSLCWPPCQEPPRRPDLAHEIDMKITRCLLSRFLLQRRSCFPKTENAAKMEGIPFCEKLGSLGKLNLLPRLVANALQKWR